MKTITKILTALGLATLITLMATRVETKDAYSRLGLLAPNGSMGMSLEKKLPYDFSVNAGLEMYASYLGVEFQAGKYFDVGKGIKLGPVFGAYYGEEDMPDSLRQIITPSAALRLELPSAEKDIKIYFEYSRNLSEIEYGEIPRNKVEIGIKQPF